MATVLIGSHAAGSRRAAAQALGNSCSRPNPPPKCSVICFLEGTQIRTPRGELPIEDLKIGDTVITVSGEEKPIRWLAEMTHKRRGTRWDTNVRPIKIEKGALGPALPHTDLLVSGAHRLFIEKALIPAMDLVNGRSVRRLDCQELNELVYYHIELSNHDVVIANGVPAETLQGNQNRKKFDNYDEYRKLYGPDLIALQACAPTIGNFGGRDELKSRLRSMIAPLWDCRKTHDRIRDHVADRAERTAQYAA